MFRGRGGPTDGRLPKHNARRRKQPAKAKSATGSSALDNVAPLDDATLFELPQIVQPEPPTSLLEQSHMQEEPPMDCYQQQLAHLQARIVHNQSTMRDSSKLLLLDNYQTHVLDALANTLAEYRALRRHPLFDPRDVKVFALLQLALQCGPLAGSQPGYFKRCGADCVGRVREFLTKIKVDELGLTEKQLAAVAKWRRDAEKAAAKAQEPSQSVIKKQERVSRDP